MAFASPVSGVSFTFDDYGSNPTSFTAFNASDAIVATGSGITDLQINNNDGSSADWYFAIQQLTFAPSVSSSPEPSSLGLAGSALVGLVAMWRSRRRPDRSASDQLNAA